MSLAFWLFVVRFLFPILGGLVAMVSDVRERRIPNSLCVVLGTFGILYRTVVGGFPGCLDSLSGFLVGFAILFLVYIVGGSGAGDVKFMGAVGAWLGPYHILFVFVLSAVVLIFFTIAVLSVRLFQGGKHPKSSRLPPNAVDASSEFNKSVLRARLPYAVPATIAIALRLAWLILIGRTT